MSNKSVERKAARDSMTIPGDNAARKAALLSGEREPATPSEKAYVERHTAVEVEDSDGDGVFEVDESVTVSDEEAEAVLIETPDLAG
jgi:hypothetical protein